MKCPSCGTSLLKDANFCVECGYSIIEAEQEKIDQKKNLKLENNSERKIQKPIETPQIDIYEMLLENKGAICEKELAIYLDLSIENASEILDNEKQDDFSHFFLLTANETLYPNRRSIFIFLLGISNPIYEYPV